MREQGEETDSYDDDDKEEDVEVVDDIEHDGPESEVMVTGTRSSLQGSEPFSFHGGESVTVGLPSEPVGAGGSATVPEVPTEGGGPAAVP